MSGPRLPEIDQASLDAARKLWRDAGPSDYDIEVQVEGSQPAVYRVSVRGGTAASATRNGAPLDNPRTFATWSVPGMFGTVQSDVDHRRQPIQLGPHEEHFVTPLGRFDPTYGYPAAYRRIEWGGDVEVTWRVVSFQPQTP